MLDYSIFKTFLTSKIINMERKWISDLSIVGMEEIWMQPQKGESRDRHRGDSGLPDTGVDVVFLVAVPA